MEPDKCYEWGWFDWNSMPNPLFQPLKEIIDSGYNPNTENLERNQK
jgi:8-oxo-dGTP diphosphatase